MSKTDILAALRDQDWRGPMQHCRAWSELDALHDRAADEIDRLRATLRLIAKRSRDGGFHMAQDIHSVCTLALP